MSGRTHCPHHSSLLSSDAYHLHPDDIYDGHEARHRHAVLRHRHYYTAHITHSPVPLPCPSYPIPCASLPIAVPVYYYPHPLAAVTSPTASLASGPFQAYQSPQTPNSPQPPQTPCPLQFQPQQQQSQPAQSGQQQPPQPCLPQTPAPSHAQPQAQPGMLAGGYQMLPQRSSMEGSAALGAEECEMTTTAAEVSMGSMHGVPAGMKLPVMKTISFTEVLGAEMIRGGAGGVEGDGAQGGKAQEAQGGQGGMSGGRGGAWGMSGEEWAQEGQGGQGGRAGGMSGGWMRRRGVRGNETAMYAAQQAADQIVEGMRFREEQMGGYLGMGMGGGFYYR